MLDSAFDKEPEIRQLNNFIASKIPAKWELFGAQVGIEQSTMDAVKINNLGECAICFQHLFDQWKRNPITPFTWSTVLKVLYSPSLGEYMLAENIYTALLQET